MNTHTKSSKL